MALTVSLRKQWPGFSLAVDFDTGSIPATGGRTPLVGCHAPDSDREGTGPLALFGASGSGKSLTLACIAGHVQPDAGCIRLNGLTLFDVADRIDVPARSRRIGCLFQQPSLFPAMTVSENIAFGLTALRGPERKRRIDEWLERTGMTALSERKPHELSGGQQQRVALARAMAPRPEALLLDEPFSALDAAMRDDLLAQVDEVVRAYEGICVLVTHRVEEAYRLCPRILVLDRGRIAADADRDGLFAAPPTPAAAAAVGCLNQFPARIGQDGLPAVPGWSRPLMLPAGTRFPPDTTHIGIWPQDVLVPDTATDEPNTLCCMPHPDPAAASPRTVRIRFIQVDDRNTPPLPILCELPRDTGRALLTSTGPVRILLPPEKLFAMRAPTRA